MGKAISKTDMPKELKNKCHKAIHTATIAAGASGLIPIPVADTVPISAAQVAMIVALGKVFDIPISDSVAGAIMKVGIAQTTGRAVVSGAFKAIPGIGTLAGVAIGSTTAAAITEALGWMVADDFYRISQGKEPEDILGSVEELKSSDIFSLVVKKHGI